MVDVIAKLKVWRTANNLSRTQAVEVMKAHRLPVALRTLQSWELSRKTPSHRDPEKFVARALESFLADHPTITDAPIFRRWKDKSKNSQNRQPAWRDWFPG